MEILKIEGLCKQYPAFSLKNVTFSMESGTVMGFIGRNGAGKTTTLKSMLRLVHPDAGHVEICGMDVAEQELAVKAQIGFVTGSAAYYPAQAARPADGGDAAVLPELGRGTVSGLPAAFRAGRGQARQRAVGGHEGKISAGACDVAPREAADFG